MLRVAVLGAGRIGKIHAANVARNHKAKLVAVADPYGTAARNLADHLGCEASLDPITAIERTDVDAIIIGTPTDTHVSLMLHGVKMGKAVLCEKPIDLDIGKVDAAVHEIERLNGRVMVAFNRRFDPSARQLRRSIDAGEIGDVRQVIITSRDPGLPPREYIGHSGGIFRDMVIHDFDNRGHGDGEPTCGFRVGRAGRFRHDHGADAHGFGSAMPYQLLPRSGLRLRSAARNLWIGRNAAERKSATDHCTALGQDRNGSARTAPEFLPGAICRGLQNGIRSVCRRTRKRLANAYYPT